MSDAVHKLLPSQVLNILPDSVTSDILLLLQQGGTGDAAGWRWFLFGASAIPPHQRHSEDGSMLDLDKAIMDGDLVAFNALIDCLLSCDSSAGSRES
jgi:hypothetical protein